jgi:hypothetical protein
MMKPDAVKQLDEALAVMLADLNSGNILRSARQARQFAILLAMDDNESRRLVEGLTGDLSRLHRSVLVLERDPEVIRRNTLAAVLMSLSPLMVGIQDLVSSPDFALWKVGVEGLVLGLEVMGTTQYLAAAKLISGTEYESGLWELEERAMEWIASRSDPGNLAQRQQSLSAFFDGLKGDKYRHEQQPAVHFVLCLILAIISYSMVRKAFQK